MNKSFLRLIQAATPNNTLFKFQRVRALLYTEQPPSHANNMPSSSQSRSRLCCWLPLLLVLHFSRRAAAAGGGGGKVPALIVFGDSTVDAGNNNFIPTVATGNFPPYGRDFDRGVATGRFSNGRLVTDFLSEAFGLPSSVPAYLDPGYTIDQLATGVSFASGGTGLDDLTAEIAVRKKLLYIPSAVPACLPLF
jgi:hypothetical protein